MAEFELKLIAKLIASSLLHTDETGINIGGKRQWLHCASNDRLTLFYAHAKRGIEAMDAKGMLPLFKDILCHDHWKPYYHYTDCLHSLCNAHHLRELERAYEQDKRSRARNLLERLQLFELDVLRFMINPIVPFTNNQGENDIRMTKVHQKISGCFRSQEGADIFCRVCSYLSTCRKNNVSATQALTLLFDGVLPDFIL